MRKPIFLMAMLALGFAGLARAQETTGPKAEAVKKEILKVEEEKLKAFQSTGTSKNISSDWVKANDAEGIVHINADGTDDTRDGPVHGHGHRAPGARCEGLREPQLAKLHAGIEPSDD